MYVRPYITWYTHFLTPFLAMPAMLYTLLFLRWHWPLFENIKAMRLILSKQWLESPISIHSFIFFFQYLLALHFPCHRHFTTLKIPGRKYTGVNRVHFRKTSLANNDVSGPRTVTLHVPPPQAFSLCSAYRNSGDTTEDTGCASRSKR